MPTGEAVGAAEAEVLSWRSAGQLPFPYFDQAEIEEMSGTLDYPPDGSPGSKQVQTAVGPYSESEAVHPGSLRIE